MVDGESASMPARHSNNKDRLRGRLAQKAKRHSKRNSMPRLSTTFRSKAWAGVRARGSPALLSGGAEYHPAASNDTAEGRKANRRVDIVVVAVDKPASATPR
jgi:hypothetical protein